MPPKATKEQIQAHDHFAVGASGCGFEHEVGNNPRTPKLGSGARFAALKSKFAKKPGITNPGALAASIGRKKYGKAKFQSLAAKGKSGY